MTFRQTDGPTMSAAKAAISTATAYRFAHDQRLASSRHRVRGHRRPDPLAEFVVIRLPHENARPAPTSASFASALLPWM